MLRNVETRSQGIRKCRRAFHVTFLKFDILSLYSLPLPFIRRPLVAGFLKYYISCRAECVDMDTNAYRRRITRNTEPENIRLVDARECLAPTGLSCSDASIREIREPWKRLIFSTVKNWNDELTHPSKKSFDGDFYFRGHFSTPPRRNGRGSVVDVVVTDTTNRTILRHGNGLARHFVSQKLSVRL